MLIGPGLVVAFATPGFGALTGLDGQVLTGGSLPDLWPSAAAVLADLAAEARREGRAASRAASGAGRSSRMLELSASLLSSGAPTDPPAIALEVAAVAASPPAGSGPSVEELRRINEQLVITAMREAALAEAMAAAQRRAGFLASVSEALAQSLDYTATLEAVARLSVPTFADYCMAEGIDPETGRLRDIAAAHVDPSRVPLLLQLRRRFPIAPEGPHPVAEALRTRRIVLCTSLGEAWEVTGAADPEHRRLLALLDPTSGIAAPLSARGRLLGVLSFVRTGERRPFEAADLPLAEEVARRAALSLDNARLFEEARQAARAREVFLARASHELRTPLTSALGAVHLIERAHEPLPAGCRDLLAIGRRNLEAMQALINTLLDASKLSAAEELRVETVPAADVVGRALEIIRPQANAAGLAIQVAVPADVRVSADPLRLEQVLVNLLANAVAHTPPGGLISVAVRTGPDAVTFTVRDTGEGIRPDYLETIFEPFVQGPAGPGRRRGGTGLGLAICRQIVTLHGGRIWAESEGERRGTVFHVVLPRRQAREKAA